MIIISPLGDTLPIRSTVHTGNKNDTYMIHRSILEKKIFELCRSSD